jgi:hypothetical protein
MSFFQSTTAELHPYRVIRGSTQSAANALWGSGPTCDRKLEGEVT